MNSNGIPITRDEVIAWIIEAEKTNPYRICQLSFWDGQERRTFNIFSVRGNDEREYGGFIEAGGAPDMWHMSWYGAKHEYEAELGEMTHLITLDLVSGWHPSSDRVHIVFRDLDEVKRRMDDNFANRRHLERLLNPRGRD